MNLKLRKKLDKFLSVDQGKNWYIKDLFIKNILPNWPKQIKILAYPPIKNNYNCFISVLGLNKNQKFLKKSKGFIYSEFIEFLIEKKVLQKITKVKSGGIVLYKNQKLSKKEFTHAGIALGNGWFVSKCSWGPLVKHKVFDVPLIYGNVVEYFNLDKSINLIEMYNNYHKIR